MLVTSSELDDPPLFARNELAARLGLGDVVFIGIGSPADYVKSSLVTFIAKVSTPKLMVVGPQVTNWSNSEWNSILVDIHDSQRIAETADGFADALLRGYLAPLLADVAGRVQGMPETHLQRVGVEKLLEAFSGKDAVRILRWVRSTAWRYGVGQPVANSGEFVRSLLALGALAPEAAVIIKTGGILDVGPANDTSEQTPVFLLQSAFAPLGSFTAIEARSRVSDARAEERVPPGSDVVVVCVGHVGPLGEDEVSIKRGATLADVLAAREADAALDATPEHLINQPDAEHLLDSPQAGRVILVTGDSLIDVA
jgi:hypothetical protein